MYQVEWCDQYGNIDKFDGAYASIQDAIAFADYLYKTRKDYHRITVLEERTGRVAHEYKR